MAPAVAQGVALLVEQVYGIHLHRGGKDHRVTNAKRIVERQ